VIAGRTPVLVTVDSPDALVSSSHVRIAHEGGAVVVTDLRSTNGTFVTPPEGRRRRLRAGESLVVLAGALIDIGDGNIIEIMSVDRPSESLEPNVTIAKGPA
jgi:pSer/pThr/pTyr-binding forkhead associated (FHA) protein